MTERQEKQVFEVFRRCMFIHNCCFYASFYHQYLSGRSHPAGSLLNSEPVAVVCQGVQDWMLAYSKFSGTAVG